MWSDPRNVIGSQVKQGAEKMLREHENSGNKSVINDTEQMLADSKQKIVVLQVSQYSRWVLDINFISII